METDFGHTLKYHDCLLKYVSVKTVPDNVVKEGWLKCIDPLSGNLILVTFDDNSEVKKVIFISGNNYKSVEVVEEIQEEMKPLIQNLYAGDTSHLSLDAIDRKDHLISWIKTNRLPVRETDNGGSLVVCESVTIYPPYDAQSCTSSNGRVLMMIRKLVSNLPSSGTSAAVIPESSAIETSTESSSEEFIEP